MCPAHRPTNDVRQDRIPCAAKWEKIHCLFPTVGQCTASQFVGVIIARCSSVVRAFAHGAMGRRIDPSWGEPTELFLGPASAP